MVNVKEYGAIGKVLDTTAVVIQGQDTVTLADAADWKVGATIGLRANATSVHRAKVTKVNGDVVTLDAAPSFSAAAAAASNDDSPAIQAALDAVGAVGGGICFVPTGTYRLGTPKFVGNLPLFVSSNTKFIGEGRQNTILVLAADVNQQRPHEAANGPPLPPCASLDTFANACVLMNKNNGWWKRFSPQPLTRDTDIEIADMTLDGNNEQQSLVWTPTNQTTNPRLSRPTQSMDIVSINPGAGALQSGKYSVFARYTDQDGNESDSTNVFNHNREVNLNDQLEVSLPPVAPTGAVAVVLYISKYDTETDVCGNFLYERVPPQAIPAWDGNPSPTHWPRLIINSHVPGTHHYPGLISAYGNAGGSAGIYFSELDGISVHDLEVRNFVIEGVLLADISRATFQRIYAHHNGRGGGGIVGGAIDVVFEDVRWDRNGWGFDFEPALEGFLIKHVTFTRCQFTNHDGEPSFGVSFGLTEGYSFDDISFRDCSFDHNFWHIRISNPVAGIIKLNFVNCKFGMAVNAPNSFFTGEGAIVGCDFDQSNGRTPAFAPDFQAFAGDYPQLIFDGSAKYRVVGNHFKPFADPAQGQFAESPCIELRGASSCLILGNHFERNPDDTRGDRANRYLLDIGTQTERVSNIISDNTVGSTDRDDHIAAYLLNRSKSGQLVVSGIVTAVERKVLVVQAEVLSVLIPLTIPMAGPDYKVQVVPQWDAGALWITDKRTDSFIIHWEESPPKLDQQQEHASGLLDYAVFLRAAGPAPYLPTACRRDAAERSKADVTAIVRGISGKQGGLSWFQACGVCRSLSPFSLSSHCQRPWRKRTLHPVFHQIRVF